MQSKKQWQSQKTKGLYSALCFWETAKSRQRYRKGPGLSREVMFQQYELEGARQGLVPTSTELVTFIYQILSLPTSFAFSNPQKSKVYRKVIMHKPNHRVKGTRVIAFSFSFGSLMLLLILPGVATEWTPGFCCSLGTDTSVSSFLFANMLIFLFI